MTATLMAEDLSTVSWRCVHFARGADAAAVRGPLRNKGFTLREVDGGGAEDEPAFFRALAAGMLFPDHFGMNWDAVMDCLREVYDSSPGGCCVFVTDAARLWERAPRTAGMLVEVWLDAAGESAGQGTPFHLVFVW